MPSSPASSRHANARYGFAVGSGGRSSARVGELMVRREEQPWQSRATLFLDNRVRAHRGQGIASSLEAAVSAAASIAVHLSHRGFMVRFVTAAGEDTNNAWHYRDADLNTAPLLEALAVLGAGTVAGGVNAVVGSGSLITFPTLLAVGYAPVTANVSNSIGLVPGGMSGSLGYRAELRGQGRRTAILSIGTVAGAVIGGVLLVSLNRR